MTEIELPPPPQEGGPMSEEDIEFFQQTKEAFAALLVAIQDVNVWSDSLQGRVNPDLLDRHLKEEVGVVVWQAEFIERILKNRQPPLAVMELISYMRGAAPESIQIREVSQEEAKRLGYL